MSDSASIGQAWDERYAGGEYRYGKAPNAYLVSRVDRISAGGRVLCVGDGEGRNGVWLATRGFDVTSIEPSSAGAAKIRRLATERGVDVHVVQATLPQYPVEQATFDAVVLIFIHMPTPMRAAVHRQLAEALAPGGVVILEAYTPDHLDAPGAGGPPNAAMMFTPELLGEDFADLAIEELVESTVVLDEGDGHQGESCVVRLVARKH